MAAEILPRLEWLELIPLTAALGVIATGMSLALSAAYLRYRDLDQIRPVAAQALFFMTPIFYVMTMVPAPFERVLVLANPRATLITEARYAFIGDSVPTAASVAGGKVYLLIPTAVALLIVVAGALLFRKIGPKAAEYA
jgi:ABC-type polysaccharide/polyol phosphate export permease